MSRDQSLSLAGSHLGVSHTDTLFRKFLRGFSSFMTRYPKIDLTVTSSDEKVSLLRREADVALRLTNKPPEYLVGRRVGRVSFCVFGERRLVEHIGADADYDEFPWLHWDERLDMRPIDEWLQKNAPKATIAMRIGTSGGTALQETIATGIAVHFLATFDGDDSPRLARIGEPTTQFDRDIWLLTLPDLRNTNRIRAFMDHLEDHVHGTEVGLPRPSPPATTGAARPKKKPPRRGRRAR